MRVLVADVNAITRRIIRLLLNSKSSYEIVGEVKDKEDLQTQVRILQPDLVILDSKLAGYDNLSLISTLSQLKNRPYLISMDGNPKAAAVALNAGADAFFLRSTSLRGLLCCLETVRLLSTNSSAGAYGY